MPSKASNDNGKPRAFKGNLDNAKILYRDNGEYHFTAKRHIITQSTGSGYQDIHFGSSRTEYIEEKITSYEQLLTYKEYEICASKTTRIVYLLDNTYLSMMSYHGTNTRKADKNYFHPHSLNSGITLNIKTGNIYFTEVSNSGNRQTKKHIRKNPFRSLKKRCEGLHKESFNAFCAELSNLFELNYKPENYSYKILIDWFIKFHKIKTTDSYINNFRYHYPSLRTLKRNHLNLTNTLIKQYKLVGKSVKKYINTHDGVDLLTLKFYNCIFPINFFNKLTEAELDCLEDRNMEYHNQFYVDRKFLMNKIKAYEELKGSCSVSEQNKIYNCLDTLDCRLIEDHIKMRNQISELSGLTIRFSFRNRDEFNKEHQLYSKIIRELSSKIVTDIQYTEKEIKMVEVPIFIDDEEYEVKLLKSSLEYSDEGIYQSHCVGGYIRHECHIVSVRKGDVRMTCEFNYRGANSQSRMKNNGSPDTTWLEVKDELDSRMMKVTRLIDDKKFVTRKLNLEDIQQSELCKPLLELNEENVVNLPAAPEREIDMLMLI